MSKRNKSYDSPEGIGDGDAAPLSESTPPVDATAEPPPAPEVDPTIDAAGRPVDENTPPLEAPKATEVASLPTSTAPTPEIRHPELEAESAPAAVREAPAAPDAEPREEWGGSRPSFEELQTLDEVEVRTVDERSAGVYVGGIFCKPTAQTIRVASVRDRGESFVRALASDPQIEVRAAQ